MNVDILRERASAIDWWHGGIDLGHGIMTEGTTQPARSLSPFLGLPDDLSGKSVLDVCTWDGFVAFECEQRNAAKVVATDSFAWNKANGVGAMHRTGRDGFDLAHEARQSKVYPVECDILDLSPAKLGTFDIVLLLGVLYHMRHPLLALERVAAMTHGLLILETHTDLTTENSPAMRFYPGSEVNNDPTNWWGPNVACVAAMLFDVGFVNVGWTNAVSQRVVFHASKKEQL